LMFNTFGNPRYSQPIPAGNNISVVASRSISSGPPVRLGLLGPRERLAHFRRSPDLLAPRDCRVCRVPRER
jgi:hypothetical protein